MLLFDGLTPTQVKEEIKAYRPPEFTLKLKSKGKPQVERLQVKNSQDLYKLGLAVFDADQIEWVESFIVIGFNRQNKVLGWSKISQGGVAGTVADPKVIFQTLLNWNAASAVIMHNHPSGNTAPSQADINLTKKIKTGAEMLEITLLDHLIITTNGYYSFADNGTL